MVKSRLIINPKESTTQATVDTMTNRPDDGTGEPDGRGAADSPRQTMVTPESAKEFYARLTAREDVRAFLKRLADR
jgi:hypothetical protein